MTNSTFVCAGQIPHIGCLAIDYSKYRWGYTACSKPTSTWTSGLFASATNALFSWAAQQPVFSLASATDQGLAHHSLSPGVDGTSPMPSQPSGITQQALEHRIRQELQEREPGLFDDVGKAAKMDRIIARMAAKQLSLAGRPMTLDNSPSEAYRRTRENHGAAHAPEAAQTKSASAMMYDQLVEKRAMQLLDQLDPEVRAAVERRRARLEEKKQRGEYAGGGVDALDPQQLRELFGEKVGALLEEAQRHPERTEFRRKLGKYLAKRLMKDMEDDVTEELMADPYHEPRFQRQLQTLQLQHNVDDEDRRDRREAARREAAQRAKHRVVAMLRQMRCRVCRHRLLKQGDAAAREGIDLTAYASCPGCLHWFHRRCGGVDADSDGDSSTVGALEAYHSKGCRDMHELMEAAAELPPLQLPGKRTWQLLRGQRRFDPDAHTLANQQQQALDGAANLLTSVFDQEEAEVALMADYAALLEHRGRPVSTAALTLHGPEWAQLLFLATKDGDRGRGHCKALMDTLEGVLGEAGVQRLVVVWPLADRDVMKLCKRSLGFREMPAEERESFSLLAGFVGGLKHGPDPEVTAFLAKSLPSHR